MDMGFPVRMNKSDIADNKQNKIWAEKIKEFSGCPVLITSLLNKNDIILRLRT